MRDMKGAVIASFSFKNELFSLFIWILLHSALSLDIPYEALTVVGEFHCFEEFRRCLSPWEYCDSKHKECRPCSEYVCSKKEEEIPLMCRLNCTITAALLKGESTANSIERHAYLWFVLMLIGFLATVIFTVSLIIKYRPPLQKLIYQLRFSFGKRGGRVDEESNLLEPENCKATQTDVGQPETMESQTERFCNGGRASYCKEKLKGTCETNEDKKVVIQTTVSQPPKADRTDLATPDLDTDITPTDGAAVQLLDATATHVELDIDLTRAKVRPAHHRAADMDSGMNSAPLKDAPSLDPSTIVNA